MYYSTNYKHVDVTQFKTRCELEKLIEISFDNTPTAIAEHLLLLLLVVAVGAPSPIPAPFCVAGELFLLVERR